MCWSEDSPFEHAFGTEVGGGAGPDAAFISTFF